MPHALATTKHFHLNIVLAAFLITYFIDISNSSDQYFALKIVFHNNLRKLFTKRQHQMCDTNYYGTIRRLAHTHSVSGVG